MKITLSKSRILELRRLAAGLGNARSDCSIEYTDGLDVDALLLQRLRYRYLELLDTADRRLLAPDNIASSVLAAATTDGGVRLNLPATCRRVFEVRLPGWNRAAQVVPAGPVATALLRRQANPYARAKPAHPVALCAGEGIAGTAPDILCYPAPEGIPAPVTVVAVTDPGEDTYILDEAALPILLESDTPSIQKLF